MFNFKGFGLANPLYVLFNFTRRCNIYYDVRGKERWSATESRRKKMWNICLGTRIATPLRIRYLLVSNVIIQFRWKFGIGTRESTTKTTCTFLDVIEIAAFLLSSIWKRPELVTRVTNNSRAYTSGIFMQFRSELHRSVDSSEVADLERTGNYGIRKRRRRVVFFWPTASRRGACWSRDQRAGRCAGEPPRPYLPHPWHLVRYIVACCIADAMARADVTVTSRSDTWVRRRCVSDEDGERRRKLLRFRHACLHRSHQANCLWSLLRLWMCYLMTAAISVHIIIIIIIIT